MKKLFKAMVKYNGNHYSAGKQVIGSEIKEEDGKVYLFDDEEYPLVVGEKTVGWMQNNTWVEVDKDSVEEVSK